MVADDSEKNGYGVDMRYRTYLEQLIEESDYPTDVAVADAIGTSKQQIYKLKIGERRMTEHWARALAPLFKKEWPELMGYRLADGITMGGADDVLLAIGRRTAWCRQYRGLGVQEAAHRFAIPLDRLNDIEAGDAEMTVREAITIATKLQATTDFILRGQFETLPFSMAEDFREAAARLSRLQPSMD